MDGSPDRVLGLFVLISRCLATLCTPLRHVGSARSYCTGVSLKRQEYRLLNTSSSRVFTFPLRSTERLFAPSGSVNVVSTEPSESIGAENASPLLVFTESSLPVSARSKNRFETSASLQSGGEPGSSPGFARQASASATGAAPTTPSTMRAASVRMLSSNTANRGGPTCLKLTRCVGCVGKIRRGRFLILRPDGE